MGKGLHMEKVNGCFMTSELQLHAHHQSPNPVEGKLFGHVVVSNVRAVDDPGFNPDIAALDVAAGDILK